MSHIALLLPDLDAGGAQQVMRTLAGGFVQRGHRVDLLVLRPGGVLQDSIPPGVGLVDLGARGSPVRGIALFVVGSYRLRRWLRIEQPAVLLSTVNGANLLASLTVAGSRLPVRLVLREANALASVLSPMRRWAMASLYRKAHAIIALSCHMADELALRLGVSCERIHYIPNPVDAQRIGALARRPLSVPCLEDPAVSVILTAGRLVWEKDHETLLRAFALLGNERNTCLIILGDGPLRAPIQALARSLGIEARVLLAGYDRNPWRWMARADLFVLSSRCEGSPNALLEAIAIGIPAVTTAFDTSVIELARTFGIQVAPVADPEGLADCIDAALGAEAREMRRGHFTVGATVDAYLSAMGIRCAEADRTVGSTTQASGIRSTS